LDEDDQLLEVVLAVGLGLGTLVFLMKRQQIPRAAFFFIF